MTTENAIETPPTLLLQDMYEICKRAHQHTSFSPDVRGRQYVAEYSRLLQEDLDDLKKMGATEEELETYTRNYRAKFATWMNAKSNCLSTMITGGSNFPVRRAEKANAREQRVNDEFIQFRNKVHEGYARRAKKKAIEDAGGELEIARKNVTTLTELQENMKQTNALYRNWKKRMDKGDVEGAELLLMDSELPGKYIALIRSFDPSKQWYKTPFAPFDLTNNNARIKHYQARVSELESKEVKKLQTDKEIPFKGGKVVHNYELDRLQLFYDEKPCEDDRNLIKSHGFKWAPSQGAWQRQLTPNALWACERLLGIDVR